jgi:hypothetical protein
MIRFELALALLLVGALIRSTLAAFAREEVRSLGLEYEPRAPAVLVPASDVEKDAAQAAEAIDPDVTQGVQSRRQHDILHR